MSRLTEIKKQYPELNITIIDLFNKIDGTKSYKYLPSSKKPLPLATPSYAGTVREALPTCPNQLRPNRGDTRCHAIHID